MIYIAHYNHIKGSSKRPESFKNYIVRFKTLVLKSKVCLSEPKSSKDVRVKSFIFLNSTLISKILLRKLDRTTAKFWQRKWSVVSIPAPQEHIGWTVYLKLCLNLCSLWWLKFILRWASNFKPSGSDIENAEFSLTFMNLVR